MCFVAASSFCVSLAISLRCTASLDCAAAYRRLRESSWRWDWAFWFIAIVISFNDIWKILWGKFRQIFRRFVFAGHRPNTEKAAMLGKCVHVPSSIKRSMIVVQLKRRSTLIIGLVSFPPDAFKYGLGGIIFETSIGNFAGEFDEQPPNLGMR